METSEVSLHQVKVYRFMTTHPDKWVTSKEVARETGVCERTSRAHLLKLVKLGILDQAEVFPAHRYRLSEFADKRNKTYMQRIEQAAKIFDC